MTVLTFDKYANNGHLIAACAELGYLRADWETLDPTYGDGLFWSVWKPKSLVACDLARKKSPLRKSVDFRNMPFFDGQFDVVVFDPPYKLNGTPDEEVDERYGVHEPTRWQSRMLLAAQGALECIRVVHRGGYFLWKCQDQVSSGKKRWQTTSFINLAEGFGMGLVDQLQIEGMRPQDPKRRQIHSHQNFSTMLVFKKGLSWRG